MLIKRKLLSMGLLTNNNMSHEEFMEAYDKLAEKYKFLLDKLDIISSKLSSAKVDIVDLRTVVSNTIKEVTGISQK